MTNPWLAIGVTTPPMLRAAQLRDAWERFVEHLDAGSGREETDPDVVRLPIADSWLRSHSAGVDPGGWQLAPVVADEEDVSARWHEHPLAREAGLVRTLLAEIAAETDNLIVVSDADGVLLCIEGSPAIRRRAADAMNFAEGTLWSEAGAGTNAVGTALAADHAVQVFAAEHFKEPVQRWTCSAAPVHDPDDGHVLGIIDLTGDRSTVHPHTLAVATATSQAVEHQLRLRMHDEDDRLRLRHVDRIRAMRGPCALVVPSGRVIAAGPEGWARGGRLTLPPGGGELQLVSGEHAFAEPLAGREAYLVRILSATAAGRRPVLRLRMLGCDRAVLEQGARTIELRPRLGEILALLRAEPDGVGAERLCADLYGDGGHPSSVRVEVCRLRKLLGNCIDSERYRLTCDLQTDVDRVEALLRRGAAREAVELYAGPLLPGSEAPGIVRERERLDRWVRQAAMTADDPDVLWAWLQCPSGRDDLQAWRRLLTGLEFHDPRRSLAASRVSLLRSELLVT